MSDTTVSHEVPVDLTVVPPQLKELVGRFGDRLFDNDPPKTEVGYDPRAWYWIRRDGSVFSSERIATVAPGDAEYVAFLAAGKHPTKYPEDEHDNESVAELQAAIGPRGGFASLEAYAAALRYEREVAGAVATIGDVEVLVSTARADAGALRNTLFDIQLGLRVDGDVLKIFADGVPRNPTVAEAKAAAQAGLRHIQAAFNLEGEVLAALKAGTIRDKAGVEAAFAEPAEAA